MARQQVNLVNFLSEAQKLAHCSRLFTAHTFACLNSKHQSIRCVAFVNQRVGSGKPLCKRF
ncbi:hypothetical protein T4A_8449 [Trichinella pseudospiralis]|uniref:Uncharacterized protein n=1 Tax=Trichinella pseudospiralis TaxID=6337 RepID=A0A0V1EQM4_TRIPS|nr:hypothetical protein T4A_8449 [Trichinella pseudospiralis]